MTGERNDKRGYVFHTGKFQKGEKQTIHHKDKH